jgi:hypothetical protein
MSGDDRLSPLPGDIRAMIDADRRGPEMSDEARQRILGRMGAGFLAAGITTAALGSSTASAAAGSGGGFLATLGGLFARKGAIVATAFVLGTAAGAGGYAVASRATPTGNENTNVSELVAPARPTASLPMTQSAPASVIAKPAVETSVPAPIANPPLVAQVHSSLTPTSEASAPPTRDAELAAERALIEMARSALAHGQSTQALDAVSRHVSKYPSGQLVEERESIAVHALVAAGRAAEAHARAESFRKRFPKSIFLPAVEAAAGSAP